MQNIPNMFIRGFPIDTSLGRIYFIKIKEYEEIFRFQTLLFFDKEDLYESLETILNINKEDDLLKFIKPEFKDELRVYPMIELIKGIKELGYYSIFKSIYDYFCGENTFDNLILTDKDLLIYKIQIMGKLNSLLNEEDIIKNIDDLNTKNNKKKDYGLFINIVKNIKDLKLYESYSELFDLCFKDEKGVFDKIQTDEELKYYLQLIIDMNLISQPEEEESDDIDPEIKKFNKYEKLIKESKQGNITFQSMYASLWLHLKRQPEFLTIYQYNVLFKQLGQFKAYDATTNGYASEVVMWCDDSDNSEKEGSTIDDIDDEMIDKAINSMGKIVGDI